MVGSNLKVVCRVKESFFQLYLLLKCIASGYVIYFFFFFLVDHKNRLSSKITQNAFVFKVKHPNS